MILRIFITLVLFILLFLFFWWVAYIDVTDYDWAKVRFDDICVYYEKYPHRMKLHWSYVQLELDDTYYCSHSGADSCYRFGYWDSMRCFWYLLPIHREEHKNRNDERANRLSNYIDYLDHKETDK